TESTKNATVSLTVRSTRSAYSPPSSPAYSGTWWRISRSISATADWRCWRSISGSSAGMDPCVIRYPFRRGLGVSGPHLRQEGDGCHHSPGPFRGRGGPGSEPGGPGRAAPRGRVAPDQAAPQALRREFDVPVGHRCGGEHDRHQDHAPAEPHDRG